MCQGPKILIDGGPVGRVSERAPVTLSHVPVGEREVRLRDASGREARQGVAVKTGRTIPIRLEILGSAADAPDQGLRAIGRNPQGYEEYWRDKDKAVVVQVPAGEFVMGSLEGQGEPTERPQHRVFVSDFLIDKLEVTWRQLRRHAEATGTPLPPAPAWGPEESYAASNVQWNEAQAYCAWVGGRLPTEAEWEKAARGTDGRLYSWGERWDPDHCNAWEGGPHRPRSVGSFAKCVSPYGVLEMPGGVWEWCADWYAEGYDAAAASHDPVGSLDRIHASSTRRLLAQSRTLDAPGLSSSQRPHLAQRAPWLSLRPKGAGIDMARFAAAGCFAALLLMLLGHPAALVAAHSPRPIHLALEVVVNPVGGTAGTRWCSLRRCGGISQGGVVGDVLALRTSRPRRAGRGRRTPSSAAPVPPTSQGANPAGHPLPLPILLLASPPYRAHCRNGATSLSRSRWRSPGSVASRRREPGPTSGRAPEGACSSSVSARR